MPTQRATRTNGIETNTLCGEHGQHTAHSTVAIGTVAHNTLHSSSQQSGS